MKPLFDPLIVGPTTVLTILGLVILSSISPSLLTTQIGLLLFGIFIFCLVSLVDVRIFSPFSKFVFIASLLFLILPYIVGELTRGTFRWITIGPVNLQPSELVKPVLAIVFARFFSTRAFDRPVEYLWGLILLAIPALVVFFEPDLGSALVIGIGWLVALVASGVPYKIIIAGVLLVSTIFPLVFRGLKTYQQNRLFSFFNPESDPLGSGYNVIQAIIAVGSGQLLGKGLGQGTQSHLRFLPENHTDFIFASLAEELGLIGIIILLGSFAILIFRSVHIASIAKTNFERILILSLSGMLFFQIFVNIGMNMGLLPVTGIPLPLISYGGSSLVSTLLSLGIINSIAIRSKSSESLSIG